MTWHTHTHGDHPHEHDHDYPQPEREQHEHGWHSPAATCSGDDTFGTESTPRQPSGRVGGQLLGVGPGPLTVTPYVPGMLLANPDGWTLVDVSASQYDYWDLVVTLAERDEPFAIVEQDMIPPVGALHGLYSCPEPWCGHSYDVWQGDIVTAYGDLGAMGLVCVKPPATQWLALVLRGWGPVTWSYLDGYVYRALRAPRPPNAESFSVHVHEPPAVHLHPYSGRESDPALTFQNPAQSEPPVA